MRKLPPRRMSVVTLAITTLAFAASCARYYEPQVLIPVPPMTPTTPGFIQSVQANQLSVPRQTLVSFSVGGVRKCSKLRIYMGDGTTIDSPSHDLDKKSPPIDHAYQRWGGRKTVTVEGLDGCIGDARTTIDVTPNSLVFAHYPSPLRACGTLNSPFDFVRAGSTVHIITELKIDFVGGVWLDANGEPTSAPAPANYPFPGLQKNSLVLRVVQQVVQGGTDVTFVAAQTGHLEFCINHPWPAGWPSTTAWRHIVSVTEPAW